MRVVIYDETTGEVAKDCDMNPDTISLNIQPGHGALLLDQDAGLVDANKVRVNPETGLFEPRAGFDFPAYLVGTEIGVIAFEPAD